LVSEGGLDIEKLLRWAKDRLKAAGIDDHETSAEILLRDLLNLSRSELILQANRIIDSDRIDEYKRLIEKRSKHVPLQYLTEFVEFYNIRLKCDPRAMIPRPETEILVDAVIERLRERKSPEILDIGTGCGNIAIALAKNIPDSKVTGIDISEEALELAEFNVGLNDVRGRLSLLLGDIKDEGFVKSVGRFDCVVSNPPYIPEGDKDELQPEVVEFEPGIALFSPGDPLGFFKAIMKFADYILKPEGLLVLEVGLGQAERVEELMLKSFPKVDIIRDLAGVDRVATGIYIGSVRI
jgi:release factor glutamine methyltransferase